MTQGHETKVYSFDDYQKSDNAMCMNNDYNRKIYEAGAASRQDEVSKLQTEIDELQKQIKDMRKAAHRIISAIDDGEISHARRSAIKMFKGDE